MATAAVALAPGFSLMLVFVFFSFFFLRFSHFSRFLSSSSARVVCRTRGNATPRRVMLTGAAGYVQSKPAADSVVLYSFFGFVMLAKYVAEKVWLPRRFRAGDMSDKMCPKVFFPSLVTS